MGGFLAGLIAGIVAYGANNLLRYAPAVGRVLGPVGAAVTGYQAADAIAGGLRNGADAQGADLALRGGNRDFHAGQNALHQMTQGQADPFQSALSEFEAFMQENR